MSIFRLGKLATKGLPCLVLACGCASSPISSEATSVQLARAADNTWTVEFELFAKTSLLGFARNPPVSRVVRWKPKDPIFEIARIDGKDIVRRRDGRRFDYVAFQLTPTYRHLEKDYAPFSSFSDGGTLVHTGRYFACLLSCEGKDPTWRFSLTDERAEYILVGGELHNGVAKWTDSRDGTVVYVGKRAPIETSRAWVMIDPAFPAKVVDLLNSNLPRMADYFSAKFGELPNKPTFFASYNPNHPDSSGSQGGTLPDQIFMHFFGDSLERRLSEPDFDLWLAWFFAHETAHVYQTRADEAESWIHEGAADAFAALVIRGWSDRGVDYVRVRERKAYEQCQQGLALKALQSAAEAGEFQLYYWCGLILHLALDEAISVRNPDKDGLFELWRAYEAEIAAGSKANAPTFLMVVKKLAGAGIAEWAERFTTTKMPKLEPPEVARH